MNTTIPLWLSGLLPLVAATSNYLNKDKLSPGINAIIASLLIIVAALAWAFTAHAMAPNIIDYIVLVGIYIAILATNALKPLYNIVLGTPGPPASTLPSQPSNSAATATKAYSPAMPVSGLLQASSLLSDEDGKAITNMRIKAVQPTQPTQSDGSGGQSPNPAA